MNDKNKTINMKVTTVANNTCKSTLGTWTENPECKAKFQRDYRKVLLAEMWECVKQFFKLFMELFKKTRADGKFLS